MAGLAQNRFAGIIGADVLQAAGVIAHLLTQFTPRGHFHRLPRFDPTARHFPAVVLAKDIAKLAYQYHPTLVEKGQDRHALVAFDHAVDGLFAIGHLGNVLAHPRPRVAIDLACRERLPGFWWHRS